MIEKNDLFNLVAKVVSFIINFIITFFISSYIVKSVGASAYGFVGLANDFVAYAQVITIALNSMASRYITIEFEKDCKKAVNEYYSSLFLMNCLLSVVFGFLGGLIIIYLERILNVSYINLADIKLLWLLILLNFLIGLIGTVFQIAVFTKKKLYLETFRSTLAAIIKAAILIVCYVFFKPMVWYIGMATVIASLYSLFYNIKYTKFLMPDTKLSISYFNISKVKTLIKSGCWNSLTQIGVDLSSGLDLLVTNIFVDSASMGLMSIAKTIPKYLYNLIMTMASAFAPGFIISYAHDDIESMIRNLKSTIKVFSVFTLVPLVLVISLGKNIFYLWVPKMDSNALYVITIAASLGYLAVMPFETIWSIYTALNKIKWSSLYLIVESIMNVLLELVFIQFTNNSLLKMAIIVGVSSFLMIIRSLVFIPLYTAKCLKTNCMFVYQYFFKNFALFVLLSSFGIFFMNRFTNFSIYSLFVGVLIIGSISTVVCSIFILDSNDRANILYKLLKKRRK